MREPGWHKKISINGHEVNREAKPQNFKLAKRFYGKLVFDTIRKAKTSFKISLKKMWRSSAPYIFVSHKYSDVAAVVHLIIEKMNNTYLACNLGSSRRYVIIILHK